MRRGISLAVSLIVMLAMTLPAAAGPPTTNTWSFFEFHCELTGEDAAGFARVFVEEDWVSPEAALWTEGEPYEDLPDLVVDWEASTASIDGVSVNAVYQMIPYDGVGDPVPMTLEGTIGEIVDQGTYSDRFRDGNRWVEVVNTYAEYEATAAVMFDDTALEATCFASESTTTETATNPHAYRIAWEDKFLDCYGAEGPDGSMLYMFGSEWDSEAYLSLQVMAAGSEEWDPPELWGEATIPRLIGGIDVVVDMFDPFAEEPDAEANVSMTVTEGESTTSVVVAQYFKVKETVTELLVAGTVELDDGRVYDLEGVCFGQSFEAKGLSNWTAGPKTSGKAPDNDLVEGAKILMPGRSANGQTKATADPPELACSETYVWEEDGEIYEETWDLPMGKTLWYTTIGTGDPLTVTTKGSNFDTVVGVYELVGSDLVQVGCADDTWNGGYSLQADLTWDSVEDAIYYIQAGGFGYWEDPDPEFESMTEYGLLKIALK